MDHSLNRRQWLQRFAALWAAPCLLKAQTVPGVRKLTESLAVIDAGGANVIAFAAGANLTLVDSGPPESGAALAQALSAFQPGAKVETLFNTHYHVDQTGNNETYGAAGAKIVAHRRTLQWMSNDYWVPAEDRYQKARPKAARPTEVFQSAGTRKAGPEQIDYGHLELAHTSGDSYVFFTSANVLAVGDAASPLRDPSLDYFTGAWIGGRVDAMDRLLALSDDNTRIVPAYGPVMTRAELKTERGIMEEIRVRLFKQVREGDGPQDMLEEGVMNGLGRTWNDPAKFLYDAAKGMWAHHNKLDHNVV